jgi:hypothetical protein
MFVVLAAILGVSLAIGCKIPVPGADGTPPTVIAVDPENLSTDVPINRKVVATFSEAMDPLNVSIGTLYVEQGTTLVPGTVSYSGVTAVFTPTSNLASSTVYTVTITTGVTDVAGNALESKKVWTFTTGATADVGAPTVGATVPAADAVGVAINGVVTAPFSEAMLSTTINSDTFTLMQGTTEVPGAVTYAAGNAVFTPVANLAPSTHYTATVTTGVKDLAGNALAADVIWSFRTGAEADATPPTVLSTVPASGATGVAMDASAISVIFSEAMNPATLSVATFTLYKASVAVSGTVTYTSTTAAFSPGAILEAGTVYTATVTTGAKDVAGNALVANKVWSFTTGTAVDPSAPTVLSTSPSGGAIDVARNGGVVTAVFSKDMLPTSISSATFTVSDGYTTLPLAGTVTYDGGTYTATFAPRRILKDNAVCTATITTGAKDLAGRPLASNKVWTFTSKTAASEPGSIRPAVVLGAAGSYVILAKTAITTTGTTAITGDVGISPGHSTDTSGFGLVLDGATGTFALSDPANLVTGKIYAADYTEPTPTDLGTATGANLTAYTNAGLEVTPDFDELGGGTIGTATPPLTPGLYTWTSSVNITGDITISGGPDDVWIFKTTGSVVVASAQSVLLSGGALAKNIFWKVDQQTQLGTTSHFEGVILGKTLINMANGATLNGRALGQTAVTLDANTIVRPAP